jgi:hypothetical protein
MILSIFSEPYIIPALFAVLFSSLVHTSIWFDPNYTFLAESRNLNLYFCSVMFKGSEDGEVHSGRASWHYVRNTASLGYNYNFW